MRAVAYCRVSTYKDEQLDSLEAQQNFFTQYAERSGYNLTKIYADEGKSGTRLKNRTQLLKLLSDAEKGEFEFVLIKDVSRLARNTVDFLTSIRKLKSLGVKVVFVNYDQTSSETSEFMLTMLSAIAQEESANTSKRVKFGKRLNAQNGKVPNFVYGYDKIDGEIFDLHMNEEEAKTVRSIFHMYVGLNIGAGKIAATLNSGGKKTKRGNFWTQTAVSRVLRNLIYTGKVINAKEEVADFLSGERKENPPEQWLICENPNLRIISDELFEQAAILMKKRSENFAQGQRKSDKHIFSKKIKCVCCGSYFKRQTRNYKNTYIKWVCAGRNQKGEKFCQNKIVVDEKELIIQIQYFFADTIANMHCAMQMAYAEFISIYEEMLGSAESKITAEAEIAKLIKSREKYMDMFAADIISITELKEKIMNINEKIERTDTRLRFLSLELEKGEYLKKVAEALFESRDTILSGNLITDSIISRVIDNIEVNENGLDTYIKCLEGI